MTVVFRASDEPVTSREERWRHVLGETVGALDPRGVPDRFVSGDVGALRIGAMSAREGGGAVRRTKHISSSDPEGWKIDVLTSGTGLIEQGGREAALSTGDFSLVDLTSPASWNTPAATELVAVVFPAPLLPFTHDELTQLSGVRIGGAEGAGAIVSQVVRELPKQLVSGGGQLARIGTAVADLLTAALASRLGREDAMPDDSRRRALLMRIHAYIETNLGDIDLSPGRIAAAHFISVRYLHKLFETEQTTVADWIRTRRLERCRRDLLDPALRSRPVSAIGARWGYPDASHFSRTFRAAYGVPPATFRSTVQPET